MKIQQAITKIGTKNGLQIISGAVLIVLTFILNGFLSFMECGFDLSAITTSQYWANFARMTASEIVVMFGMYLIQKTRDMADTKITGLQNEIDAKRKAIYLVDKVADAEEWLRVIYNYREKLIMYDNKLKQMYEKIRCIEPNKDEKGYSKKLARYNKNVGKKEFLQVQMDFVKKDFERLKLIVKKAPQEEIEKYDKILETDEYLFKTARLHYKTVFWGNLLSGIDASKSKDNTVFFNESKEISKNTIQLVGFACIISAYIASMVVPAFNGWSWSYIINLFTSALCLLWFMTRGVILSKKIILGRYYSALEKRKSVYSMMLADLGIKVTIREKSDERAKIAEIEQTD